jgi:hypothetical protein
MTDITRLANVIFEQAKPLTESQYKAICEAIDSDSFSLNEHVLAYKSKEMIFERLFFVLEDGSKVLVSPMLLETVNNLNIDTKRLEAYMCQSLSNFTKMLETINDDL